MGGRAREAAHAGAARTERGQAVEGRAAPPRPCAAALHERCRRAGPVARRHPDRRPDPGVGVGGQGRAHARGLGRRGLVGGRQQGAHPQRERGVPHLARHHADRLPAAPRQDEAGRGQAGAAGGEGGVRVLGGHRPAGLAGKVAPKKVARLGLARRPEQAAQQGRLARRGIHQRRVGRVPPHAQLGLGQGGRGGQGRGEGGGRQPQARAARRRGRPGGGVEAGRLGGGGAPPAPPRPAIPPRLSAWRGCCRLCAQQCRRQGGRRRREGAPKGGEWRRERGWRGGRGWLVLWGRRARRRARAPRLGQGQRGCEGGVCGRDCAAGLLPARPLPGACAGGCVTLSSRHSEQAPPPGPVQPRARRARRASAQGLGQGKQAGRFEAG